MVLHTLHLLSFLIMHFTTFYFFPYPLLHFVQLSLESVKSKSTYMHILL